MLTSMKERINLSMDDKVIVGARLQAVLQKRTVSEIVEELLRQYLETLEKKKGKGKP
jgi:hypothetical protein